MIGFVRVSTDSCEHLICADVRIQCIQYGVLRCEATIICNGREIGIMVGDFDNYKTPLRLFVQHFCNIVPCHICTALDSEGWSWRTNGFDI